MTEIIKSDFFIMSMRLLLAIILSGLIGFEREINNHSAGFRTHILVGVSSCLMMLMSLYGFDGYIEASSSAIRFDPARIPSYVISGIGFLGAGTIIVTGVNVKGLTTAASVWAVAGLGLVVGVGMIGIAILTTIIIVFSLFSLNKIERLISKKDNRKYLLVTVTDVKVVDRIFSRLNDHNVEINMINFEKINQEDTIITLELLPSKKTIIDHLYHDLLAIEAIRQVQSTNTI